MAAAALPLRARLLSLSLGSVLLVCFDMLIRLLSQIALIADGLFRTAMGAFAADDAEAAFNLRLALNHSNGTHGAALLTFCAANAGGFAHLHIEGARNEAS